MGIREHAAEATRCMLAMVQGPQTLGLAAFANIVTKSACFADVVCSFRRLVAGPMPEVERHGQPLLRSTNLCCSESSPSRPVAQHRLRLKSKHPRAAESWLSEAIITSKPCHRSSTKLTAKWKAPASQAGAVIVLVHAEQQPSISHGSTPWKIKAKGPKPCGTRRTGKLLSGSLRMQALADYAVIDGAKRQVLRGADIGCRSDKNTTPGSKNAGSWVSTCKKCRRPWFSPTSRTDDLGKGVWNIAPLVRGHNAQAVLRRRTRQPKTESFLDLSIG